MKQSLHIYKIGGGILDHAEECTAFLQSFSTIKELKILVHGGGRLADEMLKKLGIAPQFVEGRRITDKDTLEVVVAYYAGILNKNIVAQLQKFHQNAIGMSGADGNMIEATKRKAEPINYGWVGDLNEKSVNKNLLSQFLQMQLVPVFCAITHNGQGELLNTNADTIAAQIAVQLSSLYEVELHYCFDKVGVLKDVNKPESIIEKINFKDYQNLKEEKIIFEGMIPKLDNAFEVLQAGVKKIVLEHPKNLLNDTKTTLNL